MADAAKASHNGFGELLSCTSCSCGGTQDVRDADADVQYDNDDAALFQQSSLESPKSKYDSRGSRTGFSSRGSRHSGSAFGSGHGLDSSSGRRHRASTDSSVKFSSSRQSGKSSGGRSRASTGSNVRSVRSHKLGPEDLEMSQDLKEQLGIAAAGPYGTSSSSAAPPGKELQFGSEQSNRPQDYPSAGSGKRAGFMEQLRQSLTSGFGEKPPAEEVDEEPVPAPAVAPGEPPRRQSMMTFMTLKMKLNKFRQNMVAVPDASAREIDRGVQIEGVYDFYTFEDKKVRVRKMNAEVFHHRIKEEDLLDSDTDSSSLVRSVSQDSQDSQDSQGSNSDSDASDTEESPTVSDASSGARRERSERRRQKKKTIRQTFAKPVKSELTAERSPESPGRRKSCLKTQKLDPESAKARFMSSPLDHEACTHWGVLVGKLMHMRALDFTGLVDKASHHVHKKKFQASSDAKGTILNSVRDRARVVARQAWELAKRISKEPKDRFDWEWQEKDLLVQLFSTEYFDTLALFANTARKILAVQPSLVTVSLPCRIFGDIHGQFRDLLLLFKAFGGPDERNAPMFVFNGDFVDRGSHQLEVIGLLLALKVLLPEKVWLIRGNHEDRTMNKRYGFGDECTDRMGSNLGPKIFELMQRTFDMLPVACLIADRVLVVHGGIGDGTWKVGDVRKIKRPLNGDALNEQWIADLLWSDPIEDDDQRMEDVFGVHPSPRGSATSRFGWNVSKMFCARNGVSLIVRSHQSKGGSPGFDIMHESLLMRVFSARDYENHGNDGAVLLLQSSEREDGVNVITVRPQVLQSTTKAREQEKSRSQFNIDKAPPQLELAVSRRKSVRRKSTIKGSRISRQVS